MRAGTFGYDGGSRAYQTPDLAPAFGTGLERLGGHLLELLEAMPALLALVFVRRHYTYLETLYTKS